MRPISPVFLALACHAYVLPTSPAKHATLARPARSHAVACDPTSAEPQPPTPSASPSPQASSPLGKVKAWYLKYWKVDKAQLRALGVDAIFTYGVLSNVNVAMLMTLSWFVASRATGLSPLAPAQWKYLISTYVGFYAYASVWVKPMRFGWLYLLAF